MILSETFVIYSDIWSPPSLSELTLKKFNLGGSRHKCVKDFLSSAYVKINLKTITNSATPFHYIIRHNPIYSVGDRRLRSFKIALSLLYRRFFHWYLNECPLFMQKNDDKICVSSFYLQTNWGKKISNNDKRL